MTKPFSSFILPLFFSNLCKGVNPMAKKTLIAKTKTAFLKMMKDSLSKHVNLTNEQTKKVYDTFIQIMKDSISAENKLNLNGIGTFKVSKRKARMGRNPQTGKEMKIKASKTVTFRPTPSFKKAL